MEVKNSSTQVGPNDSGLARKLTAASSSSIFIFGIVMAILGAILPQLIDNLNLQRTQAGNLFFFMNLGMLAATLFFGPVVDRFGFKLLLALGSLLVGLSFTGLAFSSTYGLVMLSVVFLGLAGGVLNGGSNALINDLHPGRRAAALNFLGVFFGFGAMLVPLIIGGFLKQLGLRPVILIAAGLSLIPFILFTVFSFPRPKQPQGFPLKDVKKIISSGLLWLAAFILFFQSGNEFSVGGWLSSYFREKFHFGLSQSALVLSGYWFFLIVGRFLYPALNRLWKRETVVMLSVVVALVSMAGLILSPTGWLAVVFALLIGLGFAAIYPTTLAVIGEKFPEFSGTAFSLAISTGLVGGMLSPWLIGRVSQDYSLQMGLLVPLFNLAMILVLQIIIRRKIGN
ncbi:MAG: Permeases of the major facilitator superfamily [Candidatus Saccharicenans subterraneus]|uniref:Permeases of the major facilitator superfamily n=1 Tax=Candidatus Saccharicenans subterraneus TaxID=2508984 RepID=A0A3E2BKS7_9BACT|nr:MAG: Permeases of the major facilitator superfamily [Candidatus Saccharicenans subterraneum]